MSWSYSHPVVLSANPIYSVASVNRRLSHKRLSPQIQCPLEQTGASARLGAGVGKQTNPGLKTHPSIDRGNTVCSSPLGHGASIDPGVQFVDPDVFVSGRQLMFRTENVDILVGTVVASTVQMCLLYVGELINILVQTT